MSVPKTQRGEGQLVVITKAEELAEYTVKICKNRQFRPRRRSYRWYGTRLTGYTVDTTCGT